MSATKFWHWPDRTIGKRESRVLREEHNALGNSHAVLLEACQQSEYWLRREIENPGAAKPDEILRVLREAINGKASVKCQAELTESDRQAFENVEP